MKPNNIKNDLIYSKNLTITSKYIILYRGASVSIYDHNFIFQMRIPNLKYVYYGYVSPDETKLLLVSNAKRYYIFSLENFSLLCARSIRSPYNDNLEGVACWCSNDSFLLPAQNSVSLLSTIKKFNCTASDSCKDYLVELFWIRHISFVEKKNKCLIIGLNRRDHNWNVIWMDMDGKYEVYRIANFNEALFNVDIWCDTERIVLTGETTIYSCDFYGVPSNIMGDYDFENIIYPGIPEFFRRSQNDASIAYLGTSHALIIYDLKHHVAIHSYPMIFGAQNVTEFGDTIFVSSYDGVKLISLK